MSLQPPPDASIGDVFVDPITANRYEWDGATWVNRGPNAEWEEWDKPWSPTKIQEETCT